MRKIEKYIGIESARPTPRTSNALLDLSAEDPKEVNGTVTSTLLALSTASSLSEEHRREIKAALQVNQCQFDLQTVKDFIAETKREPKNEDLKFQNFIREERARVEEFYQERFNTLIDSENVRQAE